jgi:hypothetical protein
MRRMRALLSLVLFLAAALVPAEVAAQDAGARPAAVSKRRVDDLPMPAATPSKAAEPRRKQQFAAIAVTLTDDVDSVWLPPFASRTRPQPMRFFRVGIEWSF